MTAKRCIQIVIGILLCIIWHPLAAQQYPVKVQVQTLQPVSSQLSNMYLGSQARMIITLLNTDLGKPTLNVRLRLNIKGTTVSLRNTDYGNYPLIQLDAGLPVQLSLNDLAPYFNLDNMEVSGIPRSQLQSNGKLPDGFYTFCVDVVEVSSGQLISNDKISCAPPAWIATSDPPLLNLPRKGESVAFREPLNIIFNWTPRHLGSPNASFMTEYEFTMVELWDTTILPEAGFGTMPPIYQTITNATTMLYGPAEPPLLPGKRYAWRIRAIAKQGVDEFDIFTNHGYTEIYNFTLQLDCQPPQQVNATIDKGEAVITWAPQPKMFEYVVQYREQNNSKATWFSVKSNEPQAVIKDAVPGKKYDYRVGGSCSISTLTLGDVHAFEMPAALDSGSCGLLSDIKLKNMTALTTLQPDDQITAGDFPVRFMTLKNSGGKYSGTGYITVPFLGYNRVKVKFDNIEVNTDKQLMNGMLMTTFDPNMAQVANVDSVLQLFSDLAKVINDLAHLTIDADYVTIRDLSDAIKKTVEEELPEELKTRIIQAADKLVQSKDEYEAAKKELKDAKTPEEKAAAKEKVDEASKKFEAAKEEVKKLSEEKDALVTAVTGVIVDAIKVLKADADKNASKAESDFTAQAKKLGLTTTTTPATSSDNEEIAVMEETLSEDELSSSAKEFATLAKDYDKKRQTLLAIKLIFSLTAYYKDAATISTDLKEDLAVEGKTLIHDVMDKQYKKVSKADMVKYATQFLNEKIANLIK